MNKGPITALKALITTASLIVVGAILPVSSTWADMKAYQTAEELLAISQEITKDYFYIAQDIQVSKASKQLRNSLRHLDSAVKILGKSSANAELKNMILFLSFTRDEIAEIVNEPYSQENGALMLDYSETLLEGAENIIHSVRGKNSETKAMLDTLEHQAFLIERIAKFYIAFRAGFNDFNAVKQMKEAVANFEEGLKKINTSKNSYPKNLQPEIRKLNKYWPVTRKFYLGIEKNDLPLIVFVSTDYLRTAINKLIKHHTK